MVLVLMSEVRWLTTAQGRAGGLLTRCGRGGTGTEACLLALALLWLWLWLSFGGAASPKSKIAASPTAPPSITSSADGARQAESERRTLSILNSQRPPTNPAPSPSRFALLCLQASTANHGVTRSGGSPLPHDNFCPYQLLSFIGKYRRVAALTTRSPPNPTIPHQGFLAAEKECLSLNATFG
ncbi:uncharacterized protein J3D65DRAFT_447824 [Phyllosticta citribraziliensis]|uniref:Uncharacterized protein n=1 Tax=Phyllosticta citribraziliensis TaxID=989973 RepID=A0ABR1LJC2_9PEZI